MQSTLIETMRPNVQVQGAVYVYTSTSPLVFSVGIGMKRRIPEAVIRADQYLGATVCCAAVIGKTPRQQKLWVDSGSGSRPNV